MLAIIDQDTPATATIPAAHQSCDCAESDVVLMRRADATRTAYYADYRKGIIAAWGEVTK